MDEKLKNLAKRATDTWKALNRKKQFIIAGAAVAVLIAIITVIAVMNTTQYELLYSGLSTTDAAAVYSTVSAENVAVKVTGNDIYVAKGQADAVRMKLAEENLPQGNLAYDIYNSGANYAETDKDKEIKLLQQTQNRLQQTIETIPGVTNAIVTVAQSNDNTYVLESDKTSTTASVKLTLSAATTLTKSQVNGIVKIVANNVSGLSTDNVVVTDTNGNILNDSGSTGEGDTGEQLAYKSKLEQSVRQKIIQLLGTTYGSSNVDVVVNADLDFSSVSTVTNSYTSGVINYVEVSSSVTKDGSGATNGTIGTSGAQPTYSNTSSGTSTTQFSSSYGKTESALVGSVQQATKKNGATLKNLSIAVMLNSTNAAAAGADTTALKNTIAAAVGTTAKEISIQQVSFSSASLPTSSATTGGIVIFGANSNIVYIVAAAVLLLIFLLTLLLVLLAQKKKKREQAAQEALLAEQAAAAEAAPGTAKKPLESFKSIEEQLEESQVNSVKKQIEDFTDKKPELVAQILKNWLKD